MISGQPVTLGGKPDLQEKTVSPSTSKQTVTPDADYDGLSKVTVNAMITATQATPSITVGSDGLITASATQSAGYVAAGTKSATKQLTVQAAKTVTPTTSNQTAVASGRYTTGAVTVKGDSNLKAANIKKGVSIFGVTGTDVGAPVLLWTNASPTSDFNAQTISLNLTNYAGVLIEIAYGTNSTTKEFKYVTYLKKGSSPEYGTWWIGTTYTNSSGTQVSHAQREVQSITNTGVKFGYGKSGNTQLATNGIPTRIWGVGWSL